MMTRKDFQAIADALRVARPAEPTAENVAGECDVLAAEREAWVRAVREVGTACYGANPRFDRGRFEAACGYEEWTDRQGRRTHNLKRTAEWQAAEVTREASERSDAANEAMKRSMERLAPAFRARSEPGETAARIEKARRDGRGA